MMKTYAFHGDFASATDLQQDMGDPPWVDAYVDYRSDFASDIAQQDAACLVGYSRGGSIIGRLSLSLTNIVGAVLYESPLFNVDEPGGDFPVLIIWNRHSRRRRSIEAWDALQRWKASGRSVTMLEGAGTHIKLVGRPSTLFLGHGWDVSLNDKIGTWVRSLSTVRPGTIVSVDVEDA
jgi:hypothetical protein